MELCREVSAFSVTRTLPTPSVTTRARSERSERQDLATMGTVCAEPLPEAQPDPPPRPCVMHLKRSDPFS